MEKHEAGYKLFMAGLNLTEICEVLKISRNTATKWAKKHDWRRKKTQVALHQETHEEIVMDLIDYQLKTLQKKKESFATNPNPTLIERGDIDALQKLFSTIKKKPVKWSDMVKIFRDFLSYTQKLDLNTAKAIAPIITSYITDKKNAY